MPNQFSQVKIYRVDVALRVLIWGRPRRRCRAWRLFYAAEDCVCGSRDAATVTVADFSLGHLTTDVGAELREVCIADLAAEARCAAG